jgi:hypothetical protein
MLTIWLRKAPGGGSLQGLSARVQLSKAFFASTLGVQAIARLQLAGMSTAFLSFHRDNHHKSA